MINILNTYSLRASYIALSFLAAPKAFAGAPKLFSGIPDIGGIDATTTEAVRASVLDVLHTVLSFLALIAVIVIVIAGIRLILSQGEETAKDNAKKTIFYVIIGLVVILLAQAIVGFISDVGEGAN